jgi:hypothetical protein
MYYQLESSYLWCHFEFYLCFYRWLTVDVVVVIIRALEAF